MTSHADVDVPAKGLEAVALWATLLRVTAMLYARVREDMAARVEIAPEEVELLMRLSRAPEEQLRMIDVSRSLLLSKSGVTRLVDKLEQRGLVERAACPDDRRVVYATLTERGRQMFEEAEPLLVVAVAEHLGCHLGSREIAAMRKSLGAVLDAEDATASSR